MSNYPPPVEAGTDWGSLDSDVESSGVESTVDLATETTVLARIRMPPKPAGKKRTGKRVVLGGLIVLGLVGAAYAADLALSGGSVPRGVVVAGVPVGGLSQADAESKLRAQLEPRLSTPIKATAGDTPVTLDPRTAGLALDWAATLNRAGDQPLNPITRITSFFTTRDVPVVNTADETRLTKAVEGLKPAVDRQAAEGSIRFQAAKPVAVQPKSGQQLDVPGAVQAVLGGWANGAELTLPVRTVDVRVTPDAVKTALTQLATPAVSGPLVITGDGGKKATLDPAAIAAVLSFEVSDGALKPKLDTVKLAEVAKPQLAATEVQGKDAQIVFTAGKPTVQPSANGRTIDWPKTLTTALDVLGRTGNRSIPAVYADQPAKVTTEQANALGVKEVIGEFTTGGFAPDSGINIRTVAGKVSGAIVKPGETFSLNGFTGPRTAAQGYVEAGVIKDGAPGREVGGGISQFATTLYNAGYFAGMSDAGHKEHSFYISRYPAAREATVFQNHDGSSVIDLRFKNDTKTGVAIQAIWTPSNLTVRLWGTKTVNVESSTGERTDPTEPNVITRAPGEPCKPSNGAPGFTTSDTRVIRGLDGREVSRHTRKVRYNPQPKIVCSG